MDQKFWNKLSEFIQSNLYQEVGHLWEKKKWPYKTGSLQMTCSMVEQEKGDLKYRLDCISYILIYMYI